MFSKLKELVFGFDEFEKTKLEIRFEMILAMIGSLNIETLSDFEILEETLYKIRDQLRVKSSNLNRVIKDPAKKLTKKDVVGIVNKLDSLKYDFLRKAFAIMKSDVGVKEEVPVVEEQKEVELAQVPEEKSEMIIEKVEPEIAYEENPLKEVEVFSNDIYDLYVKNGREAYIFVSFKKEVDFIVLKDLSSALFDSAQAHGTNIIVDGKRALIIPRFANDNMFSLPRIEVDLEEVFSKFKLEKKEEKKKIQAAEKNSDVQEDSDDYVDLRNSHSKVKPTLKAKEDSLDELLMGIDEKKPKPKDAIFVDRDDGEQKVEVEKDDPVVVEKKEKIVKKKKSDDDIVIEREGTSSDESSEEFLIYKDEKIIAYLKSDSKVLGELIIKPVDSKKISELADGDLSYMVMFAKAFGSVLFEVKEAQGTNVTWDYNDNCIRIVPRFEKDNVGLMWSPTQSSDDFLEQVKNKLLSLIGGAIGDENMNDKKAVKTKEEQKFEDSQTKEEKDDLKKKAKYLLDSIRKIP